MRSEELAPEECFIKKSLSNSHARKESFSKMTRLEEKNETPGVIPQTMDRGMEERSFARRAMNAPCTSAMKREFFTNDEKATPIEIFFAGLKELIIIQERRGIDGECFGGPTNFVYRATQYARKRDEAKDGNFKLTAQDTSSGCCRVCCPRDHGYILNLKMEVNDGIKDERPPVDILSINRKNHVFCCCGPPSYVEVSMPVTENGQENVLSGTIQQDCCFRSFRVFENNQETSKLEPLYVLDAPSCCYGMCLDCGSYTHGSDKQDYRIYPFVSEDDKNRTHVAEDEYVGEVYQLTRGPEGCFDVHPVQVVVVFPTHAKPKQKAILLGGSQLLNSIFYAGVRKSRSSWDERIHTNQNRY